jgi:hypothetical protein
MPFNHYTICTRCRKAWRAAATCPHRGDKRFIRQMHYSWRPPKRRNVKAWDAIAAGDIYTETPRRQIHRLTNRANTWVSGIGFRKWSDL